MGIVVLTDSSHTDWSHFIKLFKWTLNTPFTTTTHFFRYTKCLTNLVKKYQIVSVQGQPKVVGNGNLTIGLIRVGALYRLGE